MSPVAPPIRLRAVTPTTTPIRAAATTAAGATAGMLHIVLNQAYHTGWRSPSCTLSRGDQDNLVANCPARTLQAGPIDLVFSDPISDLGAQVSVRAATALSAVIALLGLLSLVPKRRTETVPSAIN